jgi:hypothetical protein
LETVLQLKEITLGTQGQSNRYEDFVAVHWIQRIPDPVFPVTWIRLRFWEICNLSMLTWLLPYWVGLDAQNPSELFFF